MSIFNPLLKGQYNSLTNDFAGGKHFVQIVISWTFQPKAWARVLDTEH